MKQQQTERNHVARSDWQQRHLRLVIRPLGLATALLAGVSTAAAGEGAALYGQAGSVEAWLNPVAPTSPVVPAAAPPAAHVMIGSDAVPAAQPAPPATPAEAVAATPMTPAVAAPVTAPQPSLASLASPEPAAVSEPSPAPAPAPAPAVPAAAVVSAAVIDVEGAAEASPPTTQLMSSAPAEPVAASAALSSEPMISSAVAAPAAAVEAPPAPALAVASLVAPGTGMPSAPSPAVAASKALTGKYFCPFRKDGSASPWVSKAVSIQTGAMAGSAIGGMAAAHMGEQLLGNVPFIGGFLGKSVGSAVGKRAGTAVTLEMVGGWDAIRESSDLSFETLADMADYIRLNNSSHPQYIQIIRATAAVYPELRVKLGLPAE